MARSYKFTGTDSIQYRWTLGRNWRKLSQGERVLLLTGILDANPRLR